MELNVLEESEGKIKIAVAGETYTLVNLLRENCWREKIDQASYIMEHPYMTPLQLSVKAKDPKKVLASAAQTAIDQAKEFSKEFEKAVKAK